MHRILLTACAAVLVLSACSKRQDPAAIKTDPALTEASVDAGSAPASAALAGSEAAADQADKSIPMAMRGRWGMVPADCTSDRGDAKGLLTVEAGSIRFYESVAKLAKVDQRSETALKASYAFSGEGMEWTRDMTLALQPGGKVLIKQEFGQDAPAGPYKYIRCG